MIVSALGPAAPFYRALTPAWAFQPESGAGASAVGGRFNRPGVAARYLAESAAAALLEYQRESPLLEPATVATYLITTERIADFSSGYNNEQWSTVWCEAYCNWKSLAFLDKTEPPSWVIGDLVREASLAGILYRSAREPTNRCLVLYPEMSSLFTAPVYDPDGKLPKNADSWRSP